MCVQTIAGCESYRAGGMHCPWENSDLCFNWRTILIAVAICNFLQIIFEASMLYGLEQTPRPTYLDKLALQPEDLDDENEQQNPDSQKEVECSKVMSRCFGELTFITIYTAQLSI